MTNHVNRREFLQYTTAAGLSWSLAAHMAHGQSPAGAAPPARRKSLIGRPTAETLEAHKAAGFDGLEANVWNISETEAQTYRAAADKLDMRIHSVLRGWTNFNAEDSDQVAKDVASVATALRTAQLFGADALLLVPCRLLDQVPVPKPEEFHIEFNEQTGHVTRVVDGDNGPFQPYMQAQNQAIDRSRKAIEKLVPVAERTGVVIALENVWSNLWVKPKLFAQFVNSFQSPWVKTYFDIGNHVKYAPPEQWIEALGKTIVKVHVKDFVVDRSAARGGQFVDIREGDVNWPSVMQQFDRIGYHGWFTIEGSGKLSVAERAKRLDLILAGK